MPDLFENPIGLDGFEFVEFCAPEKGVVEPVFEAMGFSHIANHRSKDVQLWRQGRINLILNYEPKSAAWFFAREHGPSACGMGFRVKNAAEAYDELLALAREKEAQRMTWEKQARERAAALRTCVERNEALFSAGREILDAYQNLGSGSLFRMRQPLAASARVEFENQAQAFGDRLYNNQVQVTETSSDDGEQTDQSEEARNNE